MRKIKVNETLESTPIPFDQHIAYVEEFYDEIDSRIKYAASRGTVDSFKDAITSQMTEWWNSHEKYNGKDIDEYKIEARIRERWVFIQNNYKPGYWYKHTENRSSGYDLPNSTVQAYFASQLSLEQVLALYYLIRGEDTFYKEAVSWAAVACEFYSRYNDNNWHQYSVFELADMVTRERNKPIWENKKNISEELSTDAYYEKVSRLAKKPYIDLGEKLEREFGLPTSQDELSKLIKEWFDYQDYTDDEQAFDYAMAYYLSEYGNDYVFRGALDDVIDNMEASGYTEIYERRRKLSENMKKRNVLANVFESRAVSVDAYKDDIIKLANFGFDLKDEIEEGYDSSSNPEDIIKFINEWINDNDDAWGYNDGDELDSRKFCIFMAYYYSLRGADEFFNNTLSRIVNVAKANGRTEMYKLLEFDLTVENYKAKLSKIINSNGNLEKKLEEHNLPTSKEELSKVIENWFNNHDYYHEEEQAFDYAMAYYLSNYGEDSVFNNASKAAIDDMKRTSYIGVYENQNKKHRRHNKKLFENSRNTRKNKKVNYKVNENSKYKRFKRLPTFESYLNGQKRRKVYESLSDFVYGNYPSYRIEEFHNGTVALLGFSNFAEIEELANKFKDDEDFIEIAEFETKPGGSIRYVGHEVAPFDLYTKALNGEFHNGKHIEEVGNDKFSVTCDGCDEPYAIYDKKSVDYEFDGTRKQIGILFKSED